MSDHEFKPAPECYECGKDFASHAPKVESNQWIEELVDAYCATVETRVVWTKGAPVPAHEEAELDAKQAILDAFGRVTDERSKWLDQKLVEVEAARNRAEKERDELVGKVEELNERLRDAGELMRGADN